MNIDIRKKISDLWGSKESTSERYGRGFHWVEADLVKEQINKKVSGNKQLDTLGYFTEKYLKDRKGEYTGLSLGCGMGAIERRLQAEKIFRTIDAVDISEGAIKQARDLAKKEGLDVNYRIEDLNSIKLEEKKYDVIIANSSLHHVKNLEHVIGEMDKSLKKGGLVFVNEFVGPSQFQYSGKQIGIINEIIRILPTIYRKSVTTGSLKPIVLPPSIEYMNDADPSEAIRSAEIVGLLEKKLEVVEKKDYGGTLLHMLLQDIAGNFDPDDQRDTTVLKLIIYLEDLLIREKVLESDFTFMVLRKERRESASA